MAELLITVVIGILAGIAVGTQSPIAGAMSRRVGGASSSLIIHLSGALLSGVLLLARGGEQIHRWLSLPWYMLGAGAFGVVLYLALSYTVPRLGATPSLALIIVGQLMAGMVIDHFGFFGITAHPTDGWRVTAAVLLIAGGYLMLK